ncbi:hypothetical protein [Rathayibacter rathayi]|uniref:hypothetical protein n=1 Tax=Rathayibacter rathayi TaxID=33887 RepID=UPI000CE8697E|nr:hypothetical protein [Rathayibacter rathayi]PPH29279.1 hypothetical protein C5C28_14975 [Rathayibacter rathayi]
MLIPLAAVEPSDLVRIVVDDDLEIEFRVAPFGNPSVVQHGRRYLVAYATMSDLAAVASPTENVELIQRLPPRESGASREPIRHPHGWAVTHAQRELHYFDRTDALCGAVVGYAGLCYPKLRDDYFPNPPARCADCSAILAQHGTVSVGR